MTMALAVAAMRLLDLSREPQVRIVLRLPSEIHNQYIHMINTYGMIGRFHHQLVSEWSVRHGQLPRKIRSQ
jgi:hypothetical protein